MKKLTLFLLTLALGLCLTPSAYALSMSVGDACGFPGQTNIPVTVSINDQDIGVLGLSISFQLDYDTNSLELVSVRKGNATADWTMVSDISEPGSARIGLYGSSDLKTSPDSIAVFLFNVKENADVISRSVLHLSSAKLNEKPVDFITDGTFSVLDKTLNNPPVIQAIGNKQVITGNSLIFNILASDPDNDPLTYSALNVPPKAEFDFQTSSFAWTPDHTQAGSYDVTFMVTDGRGGADYSTIVITVSPLQAGNAVGENTGNKSETATLAKLRAEELKRIKDAIKAKKAKWLAEDNPVFALSDAERKFRTGLIDSANFATNVAQGEETPYTSTTQALTTPPASLEWRNNTGNFVTPVKDQGNCGSCWAFAATAGAESMNLILQNTSAAPFDLAEQVLVSCGGAGSCSGGYISSALVFVQNTGLPFEPCYKYTATNGNCSLACANWQDSANKIVRYVPVAKNIAEIKQALNTYGPVVSAFNVYADFYSYRSGVYTYTYGDYQGGHAILIVGYDDPGQYFIVKNSWGTGWGEAGYFRIAYSEMSTSVNFARENYALPLTGPLLSYITVTAPNGGESWEAGSLSANTITWTYGDDPNASIKIDLLKTGAPSTTISTNYPVSTQSYTWYIPQTLTAGSDYQIKISAAGNNVSDTSDGYFNILAPVPASLTLTSPIGMETYKPKANLIVKWLFSGNPGGSLRIELLKAGILSSNITTNANTVSGSYTWKIPANQASGTDYKVRITSNTNSTYTSTSSNNFSIVTATPGGGKVRK